MQKPFEYHKSDGLFWFRVFGCGLSFKDTTKHPLLFSERNGRTRVFFIGRFAVTFLTA